MSMAELDKIEIRVVDSIQVRLKLTKDEYLEHFDVDGRIDLDVDINADYYNKIVDYRSLSFKLGPKSRPEKGDNTIVFGYVGVIREPRRKSIDDKGYLEYRDSDDERFTLIKGIPESGVIQFKTKLDNAELEDYAKSPDHYRLSHRYFTENPPLELVPVRINGRFIRDYEEFRRQQLYNTGKEVEPEYIGKSSLTLDITNTTSETSINIQELRLKFLETFPRLYWEPRTSGQILPERRELVFRSIYVRPNSTEPFSIVTNMDSVLQLGTIQGQLRAEIPSYSISGIKADHFFLPNGVRYRNVSSSQLTRTIANIELDPKAMEESLLETNTLDFELAEKPRDIYDEIIRFLRASGYLFQSVEYGQADADIKRPNMWREHHKLDGIRKIFDNAVVRLSLDVNGVWGEYTQEREVESESTLTEKGKRATYGNSEIRIIGRSTKVTRINECFEGIAEFFIKKEHRE